MDRIARIIELEGQAARPEKIASAVRWETAQLYWEEFHAGTPQKDIADRVGRSRPHVCYMVKCWEIYVVRPGFEFDSYEALGDFSAAYRSEQVRGADSQGNGQEQPQPEGAGRRRQRPRHKETQPASDDYSAHGLVEKIAGAVALLASYPPLTGADRATLATADRAVHEILKAPAAA